MSSEKRKIESIQELYNEVKKYFALQKEYLAVGLVEKLTKLISSLILTSILILLGIIAIFYLSLTLAHILAPIVGGFTVSYAIITGFIILLVAVIFIFRKRLIVAPLVHFLANLLINDSND